MKSTKAEAEPEVVEEPASAAEQPSELAELKAAAEKRQPFTLKLKVPFKFGSELIEELTFRRPTFADAEAVTIREETRNADLLRMAGRLTGRDPSALRKLDIEDGNRAMLVTSFFSGLGL